MSVEKWIFEPLRVKSMEIPNRVGMPSMHLHFTPNGSVTDKLVNFYRERARGGVGLIVVGGCSINDTAGGSMLIGINDDKFIPGLKRLTSEIHRVSETKVAAQLYHAGRYAYSLFIGKQPVAPSPIPSKLTGETPHQLTVEEIRAIEDDFAEAAYRAKRAGFDAVELLFSAGYLVSQFLSPLTNRRSDDYGGSLENRARFGIEVIGKVREAVGDYFPIIIRQGGSDFVRGGNTSDEIIEAVKLFVGAGVDMINVTGGWHETHLPQIAGAVPKAAFAYLAYGIKRATGKPTIISNRIDTLRLAGELIRDGWGDMVNLGRPLIADPYLVKKWKEKENIRPCIACNQECFDAVFEGKEVGCTVNPFVGREGLFEGEKLPLCGKSPLVVVVGGGPAGMSAALFAARRGCRVVLFEAESGLGGKLKAASAPYDKADFSKLIEYYSAELDRLGVEIRLGVKASVDGIKALKPDSVILACGSVPAVPDIDGIDSDNVVMAEDVLLGRVKLADRIVIVGGGAVGVDVAIYILEHSRINGEQARFLLTWEAEECEKVKRLSSMGFKSVTIVEMLDRIGADIGKTTRWISLKELSRAGVKMMTSMRVERIEEDGVIAVSENGDSVKIEADQVVIATGYRSSDNQKDEFLEAFGDNLINVGDCKSVRKLPDAVAEGFEAALRIEG